MRQGQGCPPGPLMMMVNPISRIYTYGLETNEDRRKPPSSVSDCMPNSNSTSPAASKVTQICTQTAASDAAYKWLLALLYHGYLDCNPPMDAILLCEKACAARVGEEDLQYPRNRFEYESWYCYRK
jgi:hypothetical protein